VTLFEPGFLFWFPGTGGGGGGAKGVEHFELGVEKNTLNLLDEQFEGNQTSSFNIT